MDAPGRRVKDRYELVELVGRGGMASVWRARLRGAAEFETTVAFKRMLPALATDPHLVTMFVEEGKIAALLSHPNVVRVLDLGVDDDGFFLVMEWVEGVDLSRFVESYAAEGRLLPWTFAAQIGIEALRGLASAHARVADDGTPAPIVHRDVDPRNVLVGTNGITKVADFGLAFALDRARLTQPGMVKGKLAYVAPEILADQPPTPRSDLYGIGIALWEALSGDRLFLGKNDRETLENAMTARVPSLHDYRDDLPQELVDCVEEALARDPADRFESATQMADDLEDMLFDEGIRPSVSALAAAVTERRGRLERPASPLSREDVRSALGLGVGHGAPTPAVPLVRKK